MKHTPEEIKYRLSDLGVQIGNIAIEYIAELEKENAELRTRCNELFLQTMQLTNAKEIIKEFVEWANWQGNSKCPSFKSIQDKAEQFLKDSAVKK